MHAAAEPGRVGDGDHHRIVCVCRAIDGDRGGPPFERRQFEHGGDGVAGLSLRPTQPVGSIVHICAEAGSGDRRHPTITDTNRIDRVWVAERNSCGLERILRDTRECPDEIVAGTDRHHAENRVGAGDGLNGQVDHAVTAEHDETLGTGGDGITGVRCRGGGIGT